MTAKTLKTTRKINVAKSRFLITGGSGSLGRNIIKELLKLGAKNIVSISRDEELIKCAEIEIDSPYVKFKIGDIGDKEMMENVIKNIDVIFNAAAMKHVSLAEQNPREAHRINILGLLNILNSSSHVKRFIHMSSDKAIGVTNCYGATKLLGEYLVRENNDLYENNTYLVVRCPNFLGSRGSVIDMWKNQLKKDNKIKITDPDMTRYFITLPDAAKFIVDMGIGNNPDSKKIYYPIQQTKKFRLKDLAEAFLEIYGDKKSAIQIIGATPGEKTHEDYVADMSLTPISELALLLKEVE
jgi:FlaA1/EpsC-like NDP-sugar epimerase